ncbi:hypothetical protein [Zhongshania sp.]|uniref:hypothetical protein n=1 Tax=Zhongshania sp. TaxID=1971902 RepID=UPI003562BEEF
MASNQGPNWRLIILSSEFLHRLEWLSAKRFPQPSLAEAAVNEVISRLSENNWHRLQAFTGKALPETYAHTVSARLLEDYARERFGRPRPPKWLKDNGAIWVHIWQMLCLERQWPDLIIGRLESDHEPGFVQNVIGTVRARIPRCGEPGYCEVANAEAIDEAASSASLEDQVIRENQRSVLNLLSTLISRSNSDACPSTPISANGILEDRLQLSPEDRLLLALIYEDGLSSRKAAAVLNSNPSAVQRRLATITSLLRDLMQDWGISGAEFAEVSNDA